MSGNTNKQQVIATIYSSLISMGTINEETALRKAVLAADKIVNATKAPKAKEKRVTIQDVHQSALLALEALKPDFAWYNAGISRSDRTYNADKIKRAEAYIELKKAIDNA